MTAGAVRGAVAPRVDATAAGGARGDTRKRTSDVTGNLEHRPRTTSRLVYLYAREKRDAFLLTRTRKRANQRASERETSERVRVLKIPA